MISGLRVHISSNWFSRLATAAILLVASASAWGQQSNPGVRGGGARRPPKEKPQRNNPQKDRTPGPARMDQLSGVRLFHPMLEDHGPLAPEERQEIVDFLRENAPDLYDSMKRLRRQDPAAFNEQIEKAAPHLRRLRRVYKRNPEFGESIVEHTRNLQKIRRARRALENDPRDPRSRRRLERVLRRAVGENIDIEINVLEYQQREQTARRDELVQAEFDRLVSPDADLGNESPEVRRLTRRLHDDPGEREIERLEDELWLICTERVDGDIKTITGRLDSMRDAREAEVDRRIERMAKPKDTRRPLPPGKGRPRHRRP